MLLIAWIGSILLAICAAPQAYASWRQGHSDGISWIFLCVWGLGEIHLALYSLYLAEVALFLNYASNIFFISIIARYKYKPRRDNVLDEH